MTAVYWIAQHISDLFRQEPQNVGIVVQRNGRTGAKFFGEVEPGAIDGRKLRGFEYPEVYRQWVQYWRSTLASGDMDSLVSTSGSHYRMIGGGEISDIGDDNPADVVNYLYSLLVSEGGLSEALGAEEVEEATARLVDDVAGELERLNVLGEEDGLLVPHPVRRRYRITGASNVEHRPSFAQENGRLYVMETVDFTSYRKQGSRDHAGWTAYMFRDIKDARRDEGLQSISIVRATDEDQENDDVRDGLGVLRRESTVVNWLVDAEKRRFLEERQEIASA